MRRGAGTGGAGLPAGAASWGDGGDAGRRRTADQLAQESDFFSIGTNDLTQYILAADRNNPEAKRLYTPFHPAVLRELRDVIRAGRQAGIPVGLCGEAAADPELLPLLLAWGLEELSVSPALLLETRARIAGWTAAEAGAVERQVMALAGPEEIPGLL